MKRLKAYNNFMYKIKLTKKDILTYFNNSKIVSTQYCFVVFEMHILTIYNLKCTFL